MHVHWACIIIYVYETRADFFLSISDISLSLSLSLFIHNICTFQLLTLFGVVPKRRIKNSDDNWTDTHFALILHDDNGPGYIYDRVMLITSNKTPLHQSKYLYVYKRYAHFHKYRFLFRTNV